jgi:mersacidin/lichenicidin family type 2 lantibiotic
MKIVPTWKNAAYRQTPTAGIQGPLSANLIGEFELTDADLETVHGGNGSGILNHNLNGNNVNVLNNVGILGVGSSCNGGSGKCQ